MTLVQTPTYSPLMIDASYKDNAAQEVQEVQDALRFGKCLGFYVHKMKKTIAFVLVQKIDATSFFVSHLFIDRTFLSQNIDIGGEILEVLTETLTEDYMAEKIIFGDGLDI